MPTAWMHIPGKISFCALRGDQAFATHSSNSLHSPLSEETEMQMDDQSITWIRQPVMLDFITVLMSLRPWHIYIKARCIRYISCSTMRHQGSDHLAESWAPVFDSRSAVHMDAPIITRIIWGRNAWQIAHEELDSNAKQKSWESLWMGWMLNLTRRKCEAKLILSSH